MSLAQELARWPQLADLDAAELSTLAQAMEVLEVPDGHVFIEQGEKADGCFLLVEGKVQVVQVLADEEVERTTVGPGEIFGLVALIDHGPRTATCRAAGPVKVAWLPNAAFTLLHEGSPNLVLHFQSLVARQLARDARRLNDALVRAMLSQHHDHGGGFSGEFHVTVAR